MSNTALLLILEKIASKDKDFRYMATSDLLHELQKDNFKAEGDLERKICTVVLQQLEDTSADISGLAVKCLGLLVKRVAEPRAEEMVKTLCEKVVLGKKEQQRDIASIGLKELIKEIQGGTLATTSSSAITSKMLEGIQGKDNYEVVSESLDILGETVSKFGAQVAAEHKKLLANLLPHLDDSRAQIRKRALHCLAALSVYLAPELLDDLVGHVLAKLAQGTVKQDVRKSYVQGVGAISRAVGFRFGKHLPTAVPLMAQYCNKAGEGDDELREHCLQALDSFVLRSPNDARAHLELILATALTYLKFDPNFADDMEEDEEDQEADEDEDGDDDEGFDDDEDMSWKVRRAAAKCLSAIIANYPDLIKDIYAKASPELVARFREREENVKVDVFNAYMDLIRQVGAMAKRLAPEDPTSPAALLRADVAAVVRAASRQLRDKSVKTKAGVFTVLRELVQVLPGSIADHVGVLVPGVLQALSEKSSNSNLKIEVLLFLGLAMSSNPPQIFQPHIPQLAPGIFTCVAERYFKVAAEALRVCEQMVGILRPDPAAPVAAPLQPVVRPLFDCIMKRLGAQDQDQEVKERAIMCSGTLVSQLGDVLATEVPSVLKLLLERLKNEISRLTAVKAFTIVASSPLHVDLGPVLDAVLMELTTFLRKANRSLRQASLTAMEALASNYGPQLEAGPASAYVEDAAQLVSDDSDLSLATAALRCCCNLLSQQPAVAPAVVAKVLPAAMTLVRSPLLQGAALEALQTFFLGLAQSGVPQASAESLLASLLEAGLSKDTASSKQAQHSIAKCVALLSSGGSGLQDTIKRLLELLAKPGDAGSQRMALLCLGEIGRRLDLSSMPAVEAAVTASLTAESEEVKAAASLSLGGVACGNLQHFLPGLLSQVSAAAAKPKQQYLLLQALSEVLASITSLAQGRVSLTQGMQEQVLALLLGSCEGEEECRNVVSECLGRLALLHPAPVLGALRSRISTPSAEARCTIVSAIKFTITDKPHPIDSHLQECLLDFLLTINDPDHHMRRAAVTTLSAVVHHKAVLVVKHLPDLLKPLYQQTVIVKEMIRTVDLGPFKHQIDDGLDLRKAAFECLDILMDACPDRLDPAEFISYLQSGLGDHYDVKMPCHLMLSKLASSKGAVVLEALDRLVTPLQATLTAKVKSDAVKQEIDRNEDLVRSCLRGVDALNHIPGVEGVAAFQAFMRSTVMQQPLKDKFIQIEKERVEAEGGDAMDLS